MAALTQFSYSAAEIRRVRRVQFGVLSPEEIVRSRASRRRAGGNVRRVRRGARAGVRSHAGAPR
jgi:hypothetical protein